MVKNYNYNFCLTYLLCIFASLIPLYILFLFFLRNTQKDECIKALVPFVLIYMNVCILWLWVMFLNTAATATGAEASTK